MDGHRLRRELIATYVTNSLVNRAGITFAFRLAEETAAPAADIAKKEGEMHLFRPKARRWLGKAYARSRTQETSPTGRRLNSPSRLSLAAPHGCIALAS